MIHHGDLFDVLPTIESDSIDAGVTDPPYGIGFMGREWDTFKPDVPRKQAERLVKGDPIVSTNPNIHGRRRSPAISESQIFYDHTVKGLRGFQAWTESWAREVFRVLKPGAYLVVCGAPRSHHRMMCGLEDAGFVVRDCFAWLFGSGFPKNYNLGNGRGTALKPAHEPIALAWKPFKGSISANLAKHGTGALNIDACRIEHDGDDLSGGLGRWPANVLLDEEAARQLDEQTGELTSHPGSFVRKTDKFRNTYSAFTGNGQSVELAGSSGGASRFYKVVSPDCILCGVSCVNHDTMSACEISPASSAERRFGAIHRTIGATALNPAHGLLVERLVLAAPSVENLCERCVTSIALVLVETRCSGSLQLESKAFLDSIPRFRSSILIQNLACFAGLWASTDTIPTTQSLSMLFGSVVHAIGNCTKRASLESDSDPQRFLYSAKPSREERDYGTSRNTHPTVKPVELMRWLVKLVTPPNGLVLDPFAGSGTTGMACRYEQRRFIGIEREAEYIAIAERRIAAVAPLFSDIGSVQAEAQPPDHVEAGSPGSEDPQ